MIVITYAQGQARNVNKELRDEQGRFVGEHCGMECFPLLQAQCWLWTEGVMAASLQQLWASWARSPPLLASFPMHSSYSEHSCGGQRQELSYTVSFSLLTLCLRHGGRREARSPEVRTVGFGGRLSRSRSKLWRACLHLLVG